MNVLTDGTGQALNKGDLVEAFSNKVTVFTLAFAGCLSGSLALEIGKKLIKAVHEYIVPRVTESSH